MSQPQTWLRRQEILQQQIPTEPALMEGIERTNVVIVYPNQKAESVQQNPYTMNMD